MSGSVGASHSLKPPLGALGAVPLQITGDSGVGKAFSYKLGSDFTFSPAVYASCPSTSRPTLCCRASAMCQCDWQKLLPLCDVAPVSREGQYVFTCLNPFSLFVLRYLGSSALELSKIGVGHFFFFYCDRDSLLCVSFHGVRFSSQLCAQQPE